MDEKTRRFEISEMNMGRWSSEIIAGSTWEAEELPIVVEFKCRFDFHEGYLSFIGISGDDCLEIQKIIDVVKNKNQIIDKKFKLQATEIK